MFSELTLPSPPEAGFIIESDNVRGVNLTDCPESNQFRRATPAIRFRELQTCVPPLKAQPESSPREELELKHCRHKYYYSGNKARFAG